MWLRWFPWKLIVRRLARAHGFLDPIALLSRIQKFAQPSEVAEPIELLRAGVVFHARGLINSRVIQHNLDWVWPFWVERQFDPHDPAFVPRAFSITHINLTHRNWTAIGLPDCDVLPIIDPRGLLTPFFDGWSLDGWVVRKDGHMLLPSRARDTRQRLVTGSDGPTILTEITDRDMVLRSRAAVHKKDGLPVCRLTLEARCDDGGWVAVSLRPYNPEGVSFIPEVALSSDRMTWTINKEHRVRFDRAPEHHHVSNYHSGDVHIHMLDREEQSAGKCDVGMVTAAALFPLAGAQEQRVEVDVPLTPRSRKTPAMIGGDWAQALDRHCRLRIPDPHLQALYDTALVTLVLHSPDDVYPGPYTYKRFWFRDAAFIIHALICAGLTGRAERALDRFPDRQNALGFFHSQDGEWDSNGEALWIMARFCELTGTAPKPMWRSAVLHGGRWIRNKRLSDKDDSPHAGLLPAGFSAEHLGPNDYYYWDDFWGIAGLHAAARLAAAYGDRREAERLRNDAQAFSAAVDRSLAQARRRLKRPAMPASPYRRLDAGAIGSLAAGYPLQLFEPDDPRLLDTVDHLLEHSCLGDGFFQDMTHSGINPYLTLHLAQVLLRHGDARCFDLIEAVARLASPTGQWPEAVHPRTGGGCMGDGQHVWAAAEWVLMMRNCFVREEGHRLILGAGVPQHWHESTQVMSFGPAPTAFGSVSLQIEPAGDDGRARVSWQAAWHQPPEQIEIRMPGLEPVAVSPTETYVELRTRLSA